MYFTPRGKSEYEKRMIDFTTSQKLLEIVMTKQKIETFFHHYGIKSIAIAGANDFGKNLLKLLADTDIEVKYFVDQLYYKFTNQSFFSKPVINYDQVPNVEMPDVFVIASIYYFNDIADSLLNEGVLLENILNINDILFSLERLKI